MPTTKIVVTLPGGASHDVRIGTGLIDTLGVRLAQVPALSQMRRVAVVCDANAAPLFLARVKASLAASGYAASEITLPAGDAVKTPEVAAELWQAFAALGLCADDAVAVLGGCTVWNAAAFAAATYRGGIAVVALPTTPAAAMELCCGARAALDLPQGKGLVSAECVPAYVSCDVETLATVPDEAWKTGLALAAQSAVVTDEDGLFWLMENATALASPESVNTEPAIVMEMLARAVVAKADALGAPAPAAEAPGDAIARAFLQAYGGRLSAAEALACGLRATARLSERECGLDPGAAEAIDAMLSDLGLPEPATPPAADAVALTFAGILRETGRKTVPLLADVAAPVEVAVTPARLQAAIRPR